MAKYQTDNQQHAAYTL